MPKRCGCGGWRGEEVFGVQMKSGIVAKITEPHKFLNWTWWFWITPGLRSTVLARPGLHLSVLGYLLAANFVFWNEFFPTYYEVVDDDNGLATAYLQSWSSRLMVFVLTGYLFRLVQYYWVNVRIKAAGLLRGTSKVVNMISIHIDYDHPRAEELLSSLHGAVNLIGHYSFAVTSKNTKFRLSEKEMAELFHSRGYESEHLLSLHPKAAINKLHWGILQTITKERNMAEKGCISRLGEIAWIQLTGDMAQMSGDAMSVMSCTSSNKLPFALSHLVNWVTRLMTFFYMITIYGHLANEINGRGNAVPFSCVGGTVDPNANEEQPFCPTRFYVYFNVFYALTLYFILGCLEMHHALSKVWESGLVLKNYLGVIDQVCQPLLDKPKELSEMKYKSVTTTCSTHGVSDQRLG
ncbi:hypothetical protein ACHAWF_005168 [Thalassiosira exigua]